MSSGSRLRIPTGLEDNPANYDGHYTPDGSENSAPAFEPWQIYPPPPSPHWKERDPYAEAPETTEEIAQREAERRKFELSKVRIPAREQEGKRRRYEMDASGVYQVYTEGQCAVIH